MKAVLEQPYIKDLEIKGTDVLLYTTNDKHKLDTITINIYELMHRCKEWAWDNGYKIKTYKESITLYESEIREKMAREGQDYYYMVGDSEPDIVFRSCFWLMKKGKIK
ncbi:MAG: hypothetical protein KAI79_09000 [Bacteroidales bacterium]|nr:hypothetical protein [Bacteroidales bacterium]